MSTTRQWVIIIAVITALGGGLFAATRIFGDELFPVTVGSKAPKFEAAAIDTTARKKSIEDYRGEVVLLNVWATWCGPCRVEMPSMQALYRDFGPRGLKVVAVSIDDEGAEQKIRDFATEYGLSFEILFDPTGGIQRSYQTSGVPETFIIGRDGVIRNRHIGLSDWNSEGTRALVDRLLAEPRL